MLRSQEIASGPHTVRSIAILSQDVASDCKVCTTRVLMVDCIREYTIFKKALRIHNNTLHKRPRYVGRRPKVDKIDKIDKIDTMSLPLNYFPRAILFDPYYSHTAGEIDSTAASAHHLDQWGFSTCSLCVYFNSALRADRCEQAVPPKLRISFIVNECLFVDGAKISHCERAPSSFRGSYSGSPGCQNCSNLSSATPIRSIFSTTVSFRDLLEESM